MKKGQKMPITLKNRMIETQIKIFAHKSKHILQFTKKGEFVTEWTSLMSLERLIGKRRSHVADCCKGKRKTAYGYLWKYKV